MTAENRGWHAGPWKPCLRYGADPDRMFVFFDGQYEVPGRAGFPFASTLGCLELDRPAGQAESGMRITIRLDDALV